MSTVGNFRDDLARTNDSLHDELTNINDSLQSNLESTVGTLRDELAQTNDYLHDELTNINDSLQANIVSTVGTLRDELLNATDSMRQEVMNANDSLRQEFVTSYSFRQELFEYWKEIFNAFIKEIHTEFGQHNQKYDDLRQEISNTKFPIKRNYKLIQMHYRMKLKIISWLQWMKSCLSEKQLNLWIRNCNLIFKHYGMK